MSFRRHLGSGEETQKISESPEIHQTEGGTK